MDQVQISQAIERLSKRRAEIVSLERAEKANALTLSGRQATGDVGDTDSGSDLAEQEVALRLTAMESVELAKIDAAFARTRDGSYGMCATCGAQIPAERLALTPEAACCVGHEPESKIVTEHIPKSVAAMKSDS